ncbi:MAG TPA: bile acid:sodium symporter family protein [Caulobacteraceae bacterium]|jgi:sodium/bile acid cotransporter 7|nr:bile acid:sodium symporter family protein [Caulobacteraceae bacterium]
MAILLTVVVASFLPVSGEAATDLSLFTKLVIALLFFLHGAKLSREAVLAGITHWRLHLVILAATFALFPLLGLAAMRLPQAILPTTLASGVLFCCCLPSTVQSSIAFTSVARGNVAAAVCAASASNLFGIFLTPVLVALMLGVHGASSPLKQAEAIVVQLFLPFVAGQVARIWIADWMKRHARLVGLVDRGSILLVVYGAFSEAVVQGIWSKVSVIQLLWLAAICGGLLAIVLAITAAASRWLGFSKEDEIAIVFCGSKKSLATGVPMAGILFPPASVGMIVLPVMLFHQLQLMACAVIAQRYAARPS